MVLLASFHDASTGWCLGMGGIIGALAATHLPDAGAEEVFGGREPVLCAGGFVMNREMLEHYAPKLAQGNVPVGNPGDMGTGILMGQGAGGALLHMSEGFVTLPFYPPSSLTYGIFVNAQGQRFVNEDVYHARVAAHAIQQLGKGVYLVVGADDYEHLKFLNAEIVGTGETIEEMASTYEEPEEVINWYYSNQEQLASIESKVLEDQVVEKLLENANIVDKACSYQEAIGQAQEQA